MAIQLALERERGYSFIELLVVLGITSAFTAMSLGFAGSSKERVVLLVEQARVVGLLERAKSLALQGYERERVSVCYGVQFIDASRVVRVFKDLTCDGYTSLDDVVVAEQTLDARVRISGVPPTGAVLFKPPYLEVVNPGAVKLSPASGGGEKVVTVGQAGDITME